MKIDILVGGQAGSESKGLAASYLSSVVNYTHLFSVNSAQAGHTAPLIRDGKVIREFVFRQLPASLLGNFEATIVIGPGAVINLDVLLSEIRELEEAGVPVVSRLVISEMATVIDERCHKMAHSPEYEAVRAARAGLQIEGGPADHLGPILVGSTKEGVAQALAFRAMRQAAIVRDTKSALIDIWGRVGYRSDETNFCGGAEDITRLVNQHPNPVVLIEGSQGFCLSLHHRNYPLVTSRDCTASSFLAMSGLPPFGVRHVYGVFRTYPIRVAGASGPMHRELSWEEVSKRSGYLNLCEQTTVTKRVRRVGEWDQQLFDDAVVANGITRPILTFVNYLDSRNEGKIAWSELTEGVRDAISMIEQSSGKAFWVLSTSRYGGWIHPHVEVEREPHSLGAYRIWKPSTT